MDNVTEEKLRRLHGDKSADVFAEIAILGGFGEVGTQEGQLDPDSNLHIAGVLDPANKAVTDGNKNKIKSLISEKKNEPTTK